MSQAWSGLNRAEAALDRLAPLDRPTLAKVVLQGNDVDFPGRRTWEEKLYAAKERYVAHSRQLVNQMTGLMQGAQSMTAAGGDGKIDIDQAQQMMTKAKLLLSDAQTTEAAFKSVMEEGQNLAKSTH